MRPFLILLATVTSATAGELRCPTQEQIRMHLLLPDLLGLQLRVR